MKDQKIENYSYSKEEKRYIGIDILGEIEKDCFKPGLSKLPLVGNNVYIATKDVLDKIYLNENLNTIKIGKIIENGELFFADTQKLICSHIGVFGNTGSGKSNTLAKIYNEIINKYENNKSFLENAHFCIFDFNGEYKNVFKNAKYYKFSTKNIQQDNSNKYCLNISDIKNLDFWSLILNATEKTQKPFVGRSIKFYEKLCTENIDTKTLSGIILNFGNHYDDCKYYIKRICDLLNISDCYDLLEKKLKHNGTGNNFYIDNNEKDEYGVVIDKLEKIVFNEYKKFDINKIFSDEFDKFELSLLINYCAELGNAYINKDHVGPMMSRVHNRINALSNLFYISSESAKEDYIEIFCLNDLQTEFKKIVPMIICKKIYEEKKQDIKNKVKKSLHLIIDEAHNILSNESVRESTEWKDYRLETFEEIIKEGRKFSTFLTISSQRPSDISDTIISQLHNYFIHRLVNEEDLRKIRKAVSFIDSETNDMIPILPSGGCVFSGIAVNFPMLVQIDILPEEKRPTSETINISNSWNDK